jgi:hypothetical protein
MAKLVPHPLVTRVGLGIARQSDVKLPFAAEHAANALEAQATQARDANKQANEEAAVALARAAAGAAGGPPAAVGPAAVAAAGAAASTPSSFDPLDVDDLYASDKQTLADALANKADFPDLTLFAGFLGGQVQYRWRVLYLDSCLHSWLLVEEDDILVHQRLTDNRAPSGLRDVLWVRGTANVVQGSGPQSSQGHFLVGEFTRAGDFAASTTGGTFTAASGLLCEATTPGCCTARRTG